MQVNIWKSTNQSTVGKYDGSKTFSILPMLDLSFSYCKLHMALNGTEIRLLSVEIRRIVVARLDSLAFKRSMIKLGNPLCKTFAADK